MMEKINGSSYKSMIQYGINRLAKHCEVVNNLNVFPVPDGDTGTNMVLTMRNGFHSIAEETAVLSHMAQSFANATVFGARGNSGVILSQFFKGVSEGFKDCKEADCRELSEALDEGCRFAYAAVANPVEGTILTVIREATEAIRAKLPGFRSIDDLVSTFLDEAKKSLENTPNLLPILKKAGVVDSGGSGLVYFFEGIQSYLKGEELEEVESVQSDAPTVDYSLFNRNSKFEYGYCTELLLQLTVDPEEFSWGSFSEELKTLGDSLVTSLEGDKVKIHIHTPYPERILKFCHPYGEFLTLKIENMSVQHTQNTQKVLCAAEPSSPYFAVVAVAPNPMLQKMLSDMGADAVILSAEVPSSQDFLEAFELLDTREILVFPNSSNSILSAMQAGSLYKKAKITVLNCRSIAECYSSLAIIDYENEKTAEVVSEINDTIANIYEVAVIRAGKDISFGNKQVMRGHYFALAGHDILFTDAAFDETVRLTVRDVVARRDCSVVNLFYGQNVSVEQIEALADEIRESDADVEPCLIPTQNAIYDLLLSFE